ncbi:MAG TPA: C40 family peptidase [Ferruginibacter sp.]|nr:C40 family peptidase [Ferruginibacter sp.]
MKHLILVSVAVGTFSGTPIALQAQHKVGSLRAKDASADTRQVKFIDGIEITPENTVSTPIPYRKPAPTKKTNAKPAEAEEAAAIEKCTAIQFKYALLLNTEVEAVANLPLYSFIESWWGTPYRYGGASKDGIDCSAYTSTLIHDTYGITLPRTARAQYDATIRLSRAELQEGDLVFFRTRKGVSHVGIYLGNGCFTHSSTSNGVMISNLDEDYYKKRYLGGGRITAGPVTE